MNNIQRSVGLDIARATAITCVLIAHFAKSLEFLGFWGVELFFGLSGFFIGRILWRSFSTVDFWGPKEVLNFWLRRWYRTLPNYYLFLFITIAVSYLASTQESLNKNNAISENIWHVVPYLFFIQDFFDRNGWLFSISWSLCVEEWFYLLFPLVLLVASKLKFDKKVTFFVCLASFMLCSTLVRAWYGYFFSEANVRGITVARLDSIAFGVLVAFTQILFQEKKSNLSKNNFSVLSAILGIFLIAITYWVAQESNMTYEQFKKSNIVLTITPLGLALLLPIMEPYQLSSTNKIVVCLRNFIINISKWSYSIYLSHILILGLTYWLFGDLRSDVVWNATSKLFGIITTILISAAVFRWFERPITSLRPSEIVIHSKNKSS